METDVKQRLKEYISLKNISQREFERRGGLPNGFVTNLVRGMGADKILQIQQSFPDLNTNWLLTGDGEMLKESSPAEQREYPAIVKSIPYYNVDFMGNFSLVYNDNTITPDGYIQLPGYDKADCWVNVVGKSMEPTIEHGDIIGRLSSFVFLLLLAALFVRLLIPSRRR